MYHRDVGNEYMGIIRNDPFQKSAQRIQLGYEKYESLCGSVDLFTRWIFFFHVTIECEVFMKLVTDLANI